MSKYRIRIKAGKCDGDKLCCEEAPHTFALNDDDTAVVVDPDGDPPEDVLAAAKACPLRAIVLHDDDTGEQVWPL